jgi:hypothetical protein
MTIKSSAVRFNIDAANIFRAESEVAITAATASGYLSLGALTAPGYAGEIGAPLDFSIVLFVNAIDKTTGDEAYKVEVEVDDNVAFTTPTVIATVAVTDVGQKVINIAKENVGSNEFIRVKVTPSGTTPSIDYWAILSPLGGK